MLRRLFARRDPAATNLARLQRALDGLDQQTRAVFLLHRLDGLGYPEIAGRLELTVPKVERCIVVAMLALAQVELEGEDVHW